MQKKLGLELVLTFNRSHTKLQFFSLSFFYPEQMVKLPPNEYVRPQGLKSLTGIQINSTLEFVRWGQCS